MVAEVLTGLSIFKSMLDIAQGIKNIDSAVARNGIAIELTEKILAAQRAQKALVDEVGALEAKIAELEAWQATKQRYELKELANRQRAYVLKQDAEPAEQPHEACPNCYADRRISILQPQMRAGRRNFLVCHHCKLELNLTGGWSEPQVIRHPPHGRRY